MILNMEYAGVTHVNICGFGCNRRVLTEVVQTYLQTDKPKSKTLFNFRSKVLKIQFLLHNRTRKTLKGDNDGHRTGSCPVIFCLEI
jgi:hypothetical protein